MMETLNFGQTITIAAPASVANVVCGFDVLGFSVLAPYDVMTLTLLEEPRVRITTSQGFALPANPKENVAGAALMALMEAYPQPVGFDVHIDKRIKPGSGIGSSAASAAGAVYAANKLLGEVYTPLELIRFAMFGEEVASGTQHADNVAPCLLGSMTLVRTTHPLDVVRLPMPSLQVTLVHPQIEIRTSEARAILPAEVPLKAAVRQWGNVGSIVAGMLLPDFSLIARALEDVIVEPVRSRLIPGFDAVKQRSLAVGALGGGISGSGPSVFMLSQDITTAGLVEREMKDVYQQLEIDAHTYITTINPRGCWVLG